MQQHIIGCCRMFAALVEKPVETSHLVLQITQDIPDCPMRGVGLGLSPTVFLYIL